jgi:hypothetical protein
LPFSTITIIELCYLIERDRLPAIVLEQPLAAVAQPDSEVIIVPLDLANGKAIAFSLEIFTENAS